MSSDASRAGALLAVSDLHVSHPGNAQILERLKPESVNDWLLVCGDVSDDIGDLVRVLKVLRARFARVVWVPGNHELWTYPHDRGPRGEQRYRYLVELCQSLDVLTPEDPYSVWEGEGGPVL